MIRVIFGVVVRMRHFSRKQKGKRGEILGASAMEIEDAHRWKRDAANCVRHEHAYTVTENGGRMRAGEKIGWFIAI